MKMVVAPIKNKKTIDGTRALPADVDTPYARAMKRVFVLEASLLQIMPDMADVKTCSAHPNWEF